MLFRKRSLTAGKVFLPMGYPCIFLSKCVDSYLSVRCVLRKYCRSDGQHRCGHLYITWILSSWIMRFPWERGKVYGGICVISSFGEFFIFSVCHRFFHGIHAPCVPCHISFLRSCFLLFVFGKKKCSEKSYLYDTCLSSDGTSESCL